MSTKCSKCEDLIEAFREDYHFYLFSELPQVLIEKAINKIECTVASKFHKNNCPESYCEYLISKAQLLLIDTIKSATEGKVEFKDATESNLYLKKRTVMSVTCEWAELTKCNSCDTQTRDRIKHNIEFLECEPMVDVDWIGTNRGKKQPCHDCKKYKTMDV